MSSFTWPPEGSGSGSGVSSINTETGDITIAQGPGITVISSGQTITISATGSGTPGGTSGQVQYNNAGAFGGFGSWNGTTLAITGAISSTTTMAVGTNLHVFGTTIMAGDMAVQGGANFSGNLGFYGNTEVAQPTGNILTALSTLGLVATPTLPVFTSTTIGAVPASGGGTTTFLRADGSFAAPAGTGVTAVSVASTNGFAGTSSGGATPALTLSTSITGILQGNGTAISAASTTGSGNVVLATSPTLSNPAVGTQSQFNGSTLAASTSYVDTAVANAIAGVNPAVAVQAATTTAANTSGFTYNNGASGVGATFTGTTNTAVVIDGFTFTAIGQRLLVKNDTQSPSGAFNGIYSVTQIQTSLLPPILTRALDYDTPSDINNTGAIPVVNGTVNGTTSWVETAQIVTVGTTPLVFVQFSVNPSTILTNPMTTSGDVIYGGTSGIPTRLAGNTTAALQFLGQTGSGSASAAPAWTTALPVTNGGTGNTSGGMIGSNWTNYAVTITGSSTNPTKGTSTVDQGRWRRVGDSMEIRYDYEQGGAGSAGTGGAYSFSIPTGFTIDSTKINIAATTSTGVTGSWAAFDGSLSYTGAVTVPTTATVQLTRDDVSSGAAAIGSATCPLSGATARYSFFCVVPIVGWTWNV